MLDPEVVVNLLPKLGLSVDFVRHGQRFFEPVHSSTVTDPLNTPKAHRNLREIVQVLRWFAPADGRPPNLPGSAMTKLHYFFEGGGVGLENFGVRVSLRRPAAFMQSCRPYRAGSSHFRKS